MGASKNATEAAPVRGVVGRAASTSVFDLHRWNASARLDELIGDSAGELDPTYVSLTELVDGIRDDDRLLRVEQVMQHARRAHW